MNCEVVTVTPDMAKEILQRNDANRRLRENIVRFYASQMESGEWHLTGQGITIGKNGQLLDGQHRLSAIVRANIPVEMLIVRDADVVPTYDCGLKRSMSDQMLLSGEEFATSIVQTSGVAICRYCMAIYEAGTFSESKRYVSTDTLFKWIRENKEDMEWITKLSAINHHGVRGTRRSIIFATLWGFYKTGRLTKEEVERLCVVIRTGKPMNEAESPILGFRTKLISDHKIEDSEIFYRLAYAVKRYLHRSEDTTTVCDTRFKFKFMK